jgi:hypothetical protein
MRKIKLGFTTMPLTLTATLLVMLLATPAMAADQSTYEKAVTEAKAALKAAGSVGGEWRDSGKMLKQAAEAAAKGDFDKATKLAEMAKFQGMQGQAQAKAEQGVGNPGYLYN